MNANPNRECIGHKNYFSTSNKDHFKNARKQFLITFFQCKVVVMKGFSFKSSRNKRIKCEERGKSQPKNFFLNRLITENIATFFDLFYASLFISHKMCLIRKTSTALPLICSAFYVSHLLFGG